METKEGGRVAAWGVEGGILTPPLRWRRLLCKRLGLSINHIGFPPLPATVGSGPSPHTRGSARGVHTHNLF